MLRGTHHRSWCAVLVAAATWLLLAPGAAEARSTARGGDAVNGKLAAPTMEDHADYFADSRSEAGPEDQKKADRLRRKTIESIKDLLESKKKSVRRFELLLRLGELYVERHDYLRDLESEQYAKAYEAWQKSEKDKRGPEPKVNFEGSQAELTKSANSFRQLVNEFPKHPRTDAALYALGQTLARLGKDTAVDYYKQLVKSHPKSPLIPDAYLSLGEFYFDKHQIDESITYYKKVMAFKDHRAYPFAVYKLGWANYNAKAGNDQATAENYKKAIAAFKLVVKLSDKNKSKSNFDLREEAIRDLIMVWADAEDVASAYKYFKTIGEPDSFYKMLERLGNIYYDQGKHGQAIAVFNRLLHDAPKREGNPTVHAKLVELNDLTNNPGGVVAELKKMQTLYMGAEASWVVANKKDGETVAEARRLVELNMHRYGALFHQRGQKTKSEAFLKSAAAVYAMYLESFGSNPNSYDIRYYLAEILYDFKQYEPAATHYLKVAKSNPNGKYRKPAALNAVAALHTLVSTQNFGKLPPLGQVPQPLAIPSSKKKLVEAIDEYLVLLPKEKDGEAMRYEVAQIYFEHGHYPEALRRFDSITTTIPNTKQARSSVRIVLGYYGDKEDWNKLIAWSQTFQKRGEPLLDAETRKYVVDLLQASMFKRAIAYEKAGKHLPAAKSFIEYATAFPADKSADRALYNATLNYYKVGKIEEALATGKMLMEKYPRSDALPHALADMASTYEALARFDEAAGNYRRLATDFPKDPRSAQAMYNAAVLYKGLKKDNDSIQLFAQFVQTHGTTPMAPQAQIELAQLLEKRGQFPQAVAAYEEYTRRYANVNGDETLRAAAKAAVIKTFQVDKAAGIGDMERLRVMLSQKGAPAAPDAREALAGAMFKIAEPVYGDFQAYKISDGAQIEKQVGEKQQRLIRLAGAYEQIIDLGSGEWTVASLYRLGEAHENFAAALFRAPSPKGASQSDTDKLKTELEKVAFPLKEEAGKFFETAYKRSKEVQTFSAWTRRAYQKMVELAPEKHPAIDEISADPTYLSHRIKASKPVAELMNDD